MTMIKRKILMVICFLLVAVHGNDTDGNLVLRQSRPSCPHTEFKCQADQSKHFDTFMLVQFADGDNKINDEQSKMLSSTVIEQAYDFVAGTVCDLCRRRIVHVQQISKEEQFHLLDKLEEVQLVSSHNLLRTRNFPSSSDNNNIHDNHQHLFRVTVEQVGNCLTAFDTNESVGSESTVQHFIHACDGKFFDMSSQTCCCSCAADFNAMSRQAFQRAFNERMDQAQTKITGNRNNTLRVVEVLELQGVAVTENA